MFIGAIKMLLGSFLAYLAISDGATDIQATDPTYLYQRIFFFLTTSPTTALILAAVFVFICQMKINLTNAYAGSIAWSNFFSRLTHSHPGRVVWLVFNVTIALLLMELGIYQALGAILRRVCHRGGELAWQFVGGFIDQQTLGIKSQLCGV